MIGTSGADSSMLALSMPRPASAESRCSTVITEPGPRERPVHSMVSVTRSARAGISTSGSRSVRRNTMPWSTGAGRSVR